MSNKSIADVNREQRERFGTLNNVPSMFKKGDRVRIVCVCQDFTFFNGTETGVVVEEAKDTISKMIIVKFDKPYNKRMKDFNFYPNDLLKLGPMTKEEYVSITSDLVEEHFPKGECEGRGHAMVLVAEILNHLTAAGNIKE